MSLYENENVCTSGAQWMIAYSEMCWNKGPPKKNIWMRTNIFDSGFELCNNNISFAYLMPEIIVIFENPHNSLSRVWADVNIFLDTEQE